MQIKSDATNAPRHPDNPFFPFTGDASAIRLHSLSSDPGSLEPRTLGAPDNSPYSRRHPGPFNFQIFPARCLRDAGCEVVAAIEHMSGLESRPSGDPRPYFEETPCLGPARIPRRANCLAFSWYSLSLPTGSRASFSMDVGVPWDKQKGRASSSPGARVANAFSDKLTSDLDAAVPPSPCHVDAPRCTTASW